MGNWVNSPLPAGVITGFTLIAGGSGYTNPVVVISDPTGQNATATATATSGVITGLTLVTTGSNYVMPLVTIVDVGPGGTLTPGGATCGGPAPPPRGAEVSR